MARLGFTFFYGWWNYLYLILIIGSIIFNYFIGRYLGILGHSYKSKLLLIFGISINLFLIGYYKYFNFFIDSLNATTQTSFTIR